MKRPADSDSRTPVAPLDESDILAALDRQDTKRALTLLMERYGDALFRHCCLMTGDRTLGAEAHQLTYIQAYRDLASFARRSSLRTWLYAIAHHRCHDAIKSQRRWYRRFQSSDGLPDDPDPAPKADERLARHELLRALRECLRSLPTRVRRPVLLRYHDGLSYEEIAQICRERAGTLQARVARALVALRPCVEERSGGRL